MPVIDPVFGLEAAGIDNFYIDYQDKTVYVQPLDYLKINNVVAILNSGWSIAVGEMNQWPN